MAAGTWLPAGRRGTSGHQASGGRYRGGWPQGTGVRAAGPGVPAS